MQGMTAKEIRESVAAGIAGTATTRNGVPAEPELQTGDTWLDKIINSVKTILPRAVSTANAALAQLSYSGSTGNFQSAEENITLTAKFQRIVDQAPEKLGSPLYKYIYLNTISGFAVCQDAVFSSSIATMTEEIAVEQFLNNGFFYE